MGGKQGKRDGQLLGCETCTKDIFISTELNQDPRLQSCWVLHLSLRSSDFWAPAINLFSGNDIKAAWQLFRQNCPARIYTDICPFGDCLLEEKYPIDPGQMCKSKNIFLVIDVNEALLKNQKGWKEFPSVQVLALTGAFLCWKTQAHAYEQYCIHGKPGEPQHIFQPDHPHFSCNFPMSTATWRTYPKHKEMKQGIIHMSWRWTLNVHL